MTESPMAADATPVAELWRYPLRRGNSPDPSQGACLLDAVSWFEYGRLGDHPPCVCPVIVRYGIALNDLLDEGSRQRLRPYILRLGGTADPALVLGRVDALLRHVDCTIGNALHRLLQITGWHVPYCDSPARLDEMRTKARLGISSGIQAILPLAAWLEGAAQAFTMWALRGVSYVTEFVDPLIAGLDVMLAIGPQPPAPDPVDWRAALDSFDAARAAQPAMTEAAR